MKQEEYHEIYGYLPQEVINHLSEEDKRRAFISWLMMKPTAAGMFITQVTVKALGPKFIEYLMIQIGQSYVNDINEGPLTKEMLADGVKTLLETFATDTNILCNWVNEFIKAYETDSEEITRVKDEMSLRNWKQNPGIMEQFKKTLLDEKMMNKKPGEPMRDPKTGRFVKKVK